MRFGLDIRKTLTSVAHRGKNCMQIKIEGNLKLYYIGQLSSPKNSLLASCKRKLAKKWNILSIIVAFFQSLLQILVTKDRFGFSTPQTHKEK